MTAWVPREGVGQKGSVLHETSLGGGPWLESYSFAALPVTLAKALVLSHEWASVHADDVSKEGVHRGWWVHRG
jgi:hypothetical protein